MTTLSCALVFVAVLIWLLRYFVKLPTVLEGTQSRSLTSLVV